MLRASGFAIGNGFNVGMLCNSVGGAPETITCVPSTVEEEDVCGSDGGNSDVVEQKKSGIDGTRRGTRCSRRRDPGEGRGRTKGVGRSEGMGLAWRDRMDQAVVLARDVCLERELMRWRAIPPFLNCVYTASTGRAYNNEHGRRARRGEKRTYAAVGCCLPRLGVPYYNPTHRPEEGKRLGCHVP